MTRRIALAVCFACALGVAAPAAQAGTLSYEGDTLVYRSAPGEANSVYLYPGDNAGEINVSDSGADSTAPASCWRIGPGYGWNCPTPARVRVELGDGKDSNDFGFGFPASIPVEFLGGDGDDVLQSSRDNADGVTLDGGAGNDELKGADGAEALRGAAGNDKIHARGGADVVEGGDGNDELSGDDYAEPAADRIDGGAGIDKVEDWYDPSDAVHPSTTVTLDGRADDGRPGEGDNVTAIEQIRSYAPGSFSMSDGPDQVELWGHADEGSSSASGRGGDDTITGLSAVETIDGGTGNDRLEGGFGNDTITGGPGQDQLYGDMTSSQCGVLQSCTLPFGNDTIDARDGEADQIDCGVGEDRAIVDGQDTVAANCETVEKGSAGPGGGPKGACVVPKLRGLKVKAAKRRLAKAGCKAKVRYAKHRKVGRGKVIKASAKPGKRLAGGAKVVLTVSRGR